MEQDAHGIKLRLDIGLDLALVENFQMEELIARISQAAGTNPAVTKQALAEILAFLQKEAPPELMNEVFAAIPGAQEAVASLGTADAGNAGGLMGALGGLMGGGGGIMGLASKLMALGLGMGEMQTIGKELFAHARGAIGEDKVGQLAASVPGLAQFV
jgi:hypothetical protein